MESLPRGRNRLRGTKRSRNCSTRLYDATSQPARDSSCLTQPSKCGHSFRIRERSISNASTNRSFLSIPWSGWVPV